MTDPIIRAAHVQLRAHHKGELRFDEHLRDIKYVIAPDGRIVAPVMVAMIEAADTVLFIPAADDDSLQMQVTIVPFKESGPDGVLCDRWRIHHGEPPDVNWAFLIIDAARFGGAVIDGSALTIANPLAAQEAAICRVINESAREHLRRTLHQRHGLDVESPLMVALDPSGIDVRGSFVVYRMTFDHPLNDATKAKQGVFSLLDLTE